jgi:HEAT repeat protein
VDALANDLASWARQPDTRALGARFAITPLRNILGVRAHLAESGDLRIVVDGLLEGLSHNLPHVRFNCANALDHMADERCAEPLRRLLSDAVPRVRRAALHSLSCDTCKLQPIGAGEDVLPIVLDMALHDPGIRVRRAAVPLLDSYFGDERAVETLRLLAQTSTDTAVKRSAQGALRRRGGSIEIA